MSDRKYKQTGRDNSAELGLAGRGLTAYAQL